MKSFIAVLPFSIPITSDVDNLGGIESIIIFRNAVRMLPKYAVNIPTLSGLDQGKPWVGVLRKLSEVGYY